MENFGEENKINEMVVGVERTTTLLTSKLIVNPNSNIQKQAQWHNPADSMERHHAAGEQWWGQDKCGQSPLKSQCPLLDGGEAKLGNSVTVIMNTDGHSSNLQGTQSLSPRVKKLAAIGGQEGLSPQGVLKGAFAHIAATEAAATTTIFTPCRLLGRVAPQQRGTEFLGLEPPKLDTMRVCVTGADTPQHRIENKH
jgi:hypothetical protein